MRDSGGGSVLGGFDAGELAETVAELLGDAATPRSDAAAAAASTSCASTLRARSADAARRGSLHALPLHHAADLRERLLRPRRRGARARAGTTSAHVTRLARGRPAAARARHRRALPARRRSPRSASRTSSRTRSGADRGDLRRCRTSATSTAPTGPATGTPEAWCVRRTVRTSARSSGVFDDVRPDVLVPEVGNETIRVAAHLIGLAARRSRCSSSSTRSSPTRCGCTWTRCTRRSSRRTRCAS